MADSFGKHDHEAPKALFHSSLWLGVVFLFLVGMALALHYPGFRSPMLYDSKAGIANQSTLFEERDLGRIMSLVPGRPLFMLSLYGNYRLAGMEPYTFRFVSAVLLGATGLMLVMLSMVLLQLREGGSAQTGPEQVAASALVGLLFVVHPLQTYVVLYIWQRQALMACFFYLSALTVYLAGRSGRFRSATPAYVATGVLFLAGLLSKENVVSLPVAMVIAELTLLRQTIRETLRRALVISAIAVPALCTYFLVNQALQGTGTVHPRGVFSLLFANYRVAGLTPLELIGTESRVLFSYLLTIVAPFWDTLHLAKPETISRTLWDPPTTLPAVAGLGVLVAAGLALSRRRPLAAFGIFFFLITSAPESVLNPQYLFFGYRAILPMAGVLLLAADLALAVMERNRKIAPESLAIAGILAATVFGAVTVSQARRWHPLIFWTDAFQALPAFSRDVEPRAYFDILVNYGGELINAGDFRHASEILARAVEIDPQSNLAKTKLGLAYQRSGAMEEAIEQFTWIARKNPSDASALVNLGVALTRGGKTPEGIMVLKQAVKLNPRNESAYINLGLAFLGSGDTQKAIQSFERAVEARPLSLPARVHLGRALRKSGDVRKAIDVFTEAVRIDPRSELAHSALGLALEQSGDMAGAVESYRKAAELEPGLAEAHYRLANALMRIGELENSIGSFRRAVQLKPDFADAYANLGAALLSAGRPAEAVTSLQKALALREDNAELHNVLGVAYAQLGDREKAIEQFTRALSIDPAHAGARLNLERARQE